MRDAQGRVSEAFAPDAEALAHPSSPASLQPWADSASRPVVPARRADGPQKHQSRAPQWSSQARSHSTQQTKFSVGCCGFPNFVAGFQFKMFVVTFLTQAQELARSVFAGVAGFPCVEPGMCEVCLNAEVWKSVAADHRIPLALFPHRERDRNRCPTSHVVRRSHMVVLLVKTNLDTDLLDAVIHIQFCASNLGSCPG